MNLKRLPYHKYINICPLCSNNEIKVEALICKGAHGRIKHCSLCGNMLIDMNIDPQLPGSREDGYDKKTRNYRPG